jgi:GntR family transcriptional regulator/MocR family aminotransferase
MELHIVIQEGHDLTGQLYRQLRDAIRSGQLVDGEQLPPSRLLASQLGLSRKTVSEAYARLSYDQLLVGRVGAGSFVHAPLTPRLRKATSDDLAGAAVVRQWAGMSTALQHAVPEGGSRYEYMGGATSVPFPIDEWRSCMLHALRTGMRARGRYAQANGLQSLREAVCRHVAFSRGVQCVADDIVITNGAQQALDLVARVLVEPGCTVAVEEPGYPLAALLFASHGAHIVGVPVDADGMLTDRIPAGARLIYVTPAHQFPLGMQMRLPRRHALLARAREIGAIVMEDDYDSAFRYGSRPVDALQSIDDYGIVVHVGTFSKVLLPELRVGYLIAPPALLAALLAAKQLTDWHTATIVQHALARFITEGHLQKHIRRCHGIYTARRERLVQQLEGPLSRWFELIPASAGFHMSALCRRPLDLALLLRLARRMEIGIYTLDGFYRFSQPRDGLFLGYGAIDTLDIDYSMARIAEILVQMEQAS